MLDFTLKLVLWFLPFGIPQPSLVVEQPAWAFCVPPDLEASKPVDEFLCELDETYTLALGPFDVTQSVGNCEDGPTAGEAPYAEFSR